MLKLFARPRITLLLLVLASMSLVTLNYRGGAKFSFVSIKAAVRDVVSPVRSTANGIFRPVGNFFTGAFEYGSTKTKLAQVQNELDQLKLVQYSQLDAQRQLDQLLTLSKIQFAQGIPSIEAQVVGQTPTNIQLSFELNKGSSQGVKLGMVVVGGSGLAGRVVAVSSGTSTVLMLSDPNFVAGVRYGKGGNIAVATGQGVNLPLKLGLIDPGSNIRVGQVLVTSGLQGEIYPAGIPVGVVSSVSNPIGGLQEQVLVKPLVNYSNLQFVKILEWAPPA